MPKREKKSLLLWEVTKKLPFWLDQISSLLLTGIYTSYYYITGIKQQHIICQAWNSFQSLLLLFPKSLLPSTVTQGRNLEVICNSPSPALFYPSRQPIFIKSLNVLANLLGTRDTTMTKKTKIISINKEVWEVKYYWLTPNFPFFWPYAQYVGS